MRKYLMFILSIFLVMTLVGCGNKKDVKYINEGKVLQSHEILGNVKRQKPVISNGGLDRYPEYNVSFEGTLEEKQLIADENKLLNASSTTYDSMDENGNLFLEGQPINKKLYKHSASIGLYGGDVSDEEKAVIKKINITPRPLGNYITGLYAPAGEVIKIEISEEDLTKTGGFNVFIGNAGNRSSGAAEIPLEKVFSRMPYTVNEMRVSSTTTYVGSFLGGAIYLGEPKNKNVSYTVTISGAVEYSHFILGLTTKEEFDRTVNSSAPYFDLEVWDDGIRHSGPKYMLDELEYDNFYHVARMWEKISLVSNQVPSASANVGISMRYDTYIPAGAAVAFVGANFCVLPISWFNGSLSYENFTTNGMWGTIHELNHHYQQYGAPDGGEVTNNAVSLLSYALYTKISAARNINGDLSGWNAYTYANYPLKLLLNNENENPIYSIESYAVLIHCFGVDAFLKAISLQEIKGNADSWYKAWSMATGYDMTYYFEELCNYDLGEEVKAYVKELNYEIFVPAASIFQTKASYNEMINTVQPYEIDYQQSIDVNLKDSILIPDGFEFKILEIKSDTLGELVKNTNGFIYTPSEDDFNSNKIDVTIQLEKADGSFDVKPITLTFEFIQKAKKVEVTTYTFNDETAYRNIAIAEANNFSGYTKIESSFSNSFNISNLPKNTITVCEGKIYINNAGKYRIYIKGRDNVFMYISQNNDKNYELVSYLNSNSNYSNENENAYYDIDIKKPTYVYIKTITLSKTDNGYSDVGYGKFKDDVVSVSTIPSKYILNKKEEYDNSYFETINHYPRIYYSTNCLINVNDFSVVESENFNAWNDDYTLNKMLDGNKNTYAHNNVILKDPISITIDMNNINRFNYLEIFGKNSEESHTPTTFDLYFGNTLEELSLYNSYSNLSLNNRSVLLDFNEEITSRYLKLIIKKTESNRYVAISELEIGTKIPESRLIGITDEKINITGNWEMTNNKYSDFASVISSKNGTIEFEFTGSVIGLYGIVLEDGAIKISIDGSKYEEINLNGNNKLDLLYFNDSLDNKTHTIKIKVKNKNILFSSMFYS